MKKFATVIGMLCFVLAGCTAVDAPTETASDVSISGDIMPFDEALLVFEAWHIPGKAVSGEAAEILKNCVSNGKCAKRTSKNSECDFKVNQERLKVDEFRCFNLVTAKNIYACIIGCAYSAKEGSTVFLFYKEDGNVVYYLTFDEYQTIMELSNLW